MKRIGLIVLLSLAAAAAWAQAPFAGRSFRLAEQGETGPFMTTCAFEIEGTYRWSFSTGESESKRRGTYLARPDASTSVTGHSFGTIEMEYVQEDSDFLGRVSESKGTAAYNYAFAHGVLVLYDDERIRTIWTDGHGHLYQPEYTAEATSELVETLSGGTVRYAAANALPDASLNDFWSEGEPGPGVGSEIVFPFANTQGEKPRAVIVYSGVHRRDDLFEKNARPKEISVYYAPEHSLEASIVLADTSQPQIFLLPGSFEVPGVHLGVDSVYPGSRWEDMCITAVSILAEAW